MFPQSQTYQPIRYSHWVWHLATLLLAALPLSAQAHPGHSLESDPVSHQSAANSKNLGDDSTQVQQNSPLPIRETQGMVFAGIGLIGQTTSSGQNQVQISVQGNYRYISANGIPNHATGQFPNQGNPNRIAPQQHRFRMPVNPKLANTSTPLSLGKFGVAVNGIPFEPGAAEFWNRNPRSGWQYDALSGKINLGFDRNNAHVQPGGLYHYHGLPTGLIAALGNGQRMMLLGYAADGFPIYSAYGYANPRSASSGVRALRPSYRLKQGQRPSGPGGQYDGTFVQDYQYVAGSGDLDECNGRFGVTPDFPNGLYHYYLTSTFPFIPRCFKGTPDGSFQVRGGGFPGNNGQPGSGPPGRRPPDGRPPGGGPPGGRPPGPPPFGYPPPPRSF